MKEETFTLSLSRFKDVIPRDENHIFQTIFENITRNIESKFEGEVTCGQSEGVLKGSYPFIPNNGLYRIIQTTKAIKLKLMYGDTDENSWNKYPETFLDVGCGYGNIMALANFNGFKVSGIEIDKRLIDIGKTLWGKGFKFYNENAFKFKKYKDFDVIYYYCPMRDVEKEKELEEIIERKMKKGAYLIPCLKQSFKIVNKKNFVVINGLPLTIYRKR